MVDAKLAQGVQLKHDIDKLTRASNDLGNATSFTAGAIQVTLNQANNYRIANIDISSVDPAALITAISTLVTSTLTTKQTAYAALPAA